MMKLDVKDFKRQLKSFETAVRLSAAKLSGEKAEKFTRAVAFKTLNAILANHKYPATRKPPTHWGRIVGGLKDPVNTRRLAGGWGLAGKTLGVVQPNVEGATQRPNDGTGEVKKSRFGFTFKATNNVEYVNYIEFGTDKSPARTPVTRAIASVERVLKGDEMLKEAVEAVAREFQKQGFQVHIP